MDDLSFQLHHKIGKQKTLGEPQVESFNYAENVSVVDYTWPILLHRFSMMKFEHSLFLDLKITLN